MIRKVKTDVVETGAFTAPPPPAGLVSPRKERFRPVKGGTSVSHINSSIPGTIGCALKVGKETVLVSANHAVALLNDANPGDPILQPAKEDGGTRDDVIGSLDDMYMIKLRAKAERYGRGDN